MFCGFDLIYIVTMNVYRLTGDILHLLSILYLLQKLIRSRSCGGFSAKTQLLFAIVYTTRYFDLFQTYYSAYNHSMKIIYITCSYLIVLLMLVVFRKTYKRKKDTFVTELLLVPCFLLALWINHEMTFLEISWTFSIFLEPLAILPQFLMICKRKVIESSLLIYLVPLGLYRLCYIFNWIYRYYNEGHCYDAIADSAAIIYVIIYICAVIEFCIIKIKIINEEDKGHFLQKNIFFVSVDDHDQELLHNEKTIPSNNEKF